MDKIRFSVVGYGAMGHFHTEKLLASGKFECAGIWDINPEQREDARVNGIPVYSSFEELIEDKSTALAIVSVWNDLHRPLSIGLMKAGKSVVCEKPAGLNSKELEEMISTAGDLGLVFTSTRTKRRDRDFLTVKNIIDKKLLGKLFRIERRSGSYSGLSQDWRSEAAYGGGVIYGGGIHLIDQMLTVCEKDKLVSVYAKTTHITSVECDDGFFADFTFLSGLVWHLELTTNQFVELPRWLLLGENGSSIVNADGTGKNVGVLDWASINAVPVKAGAGITKTMAPRSADTIREEAVETVSGNAGEFYDNLYAAITAGTPLTVNHRQMRRCMKVLEAVFESAESKSVISFADDYTE